MPIQTTENQRTTVHAARQARRAAQPAVCLQCKSDSWAGTRRVLRAAAACAPQLKLAVGRPGDPYEREADRAAAQLAAGLPVSPISALPPGGLRPKSLRQTLQAFGGSSLSSSLDEQLTRPPSGGVPLPEATRSRMESGFGADFSGVRVHTGAEAAQMNQGLNAQAFARGSHIYFGAGRYNPESDAGRNLVAHELTHVVQQGAAQQGHTTQTQASAASGTVQRNNAPSERGLLGRIWDATGGRLMQAGADMVWGLLRERAPQLADLLQAVRRVGILGYLRERIGGAFSRIFHRLRANNAVAARLFQVFNLIVAQAGIIIGGLRSGSCRPLFAAIERLKQAVAQVAGDAWNAITEFFRPVGDFFADIWRRFGAPVVEWIQDVAGDVWEYITGLGRSIWEWMAPVRRAFSDAWEWLKAQLGLGGDQGNDQGGLVQWVRDKAGEAWSAIRETLAPVIAPIQGVVQRIREILPLEAIANLRETITGWLNNVGAMTQRLEQENGVADQQTSLRQEILPGVLRAIRQLRTRMVGAGQWVAGCIGRLADSVQGFFGGLGRQALLRPVIAILRWVPEGVGRFNLWAQSTVRRLFDYLGNGLVYLSQFIEPVLGTLQKVVEVLGDLAGKLSELIFGRFWRLIPSCIRDPIKNFIVERILSNIPVFGQLLRIPNIWQRVQATAMRILRQVFVSGDLLGAAWTFFREVLSLINIPAQLVTGIIRKAASALGDILSNPIGFLVNLVQGMVRGFVQFCGNIGRHLLSGISGWLFGQLRQAGIQPPSDFSLASILGFVLQVLDITRERIFQRMARHPRIGPERVARLRTFFNRLSGAWEWVRVLMREGPAGLWRMLRERLGNLWQTVLNSIISWISTRVISRALARLATMADPTGIGAVVNIIVTIYQAIQTAAQYARQILEAVNRFLDGINSIARGALGPAATFLENALVRLLPAAIGFVANWVGLGNLGQRIREMVERIRTQVDRALDWLIERGVRTVDAALRGLRAVGGAIRRGAERVLQWWRIQRQFTGPDRGSHTLSLDRRNDRAIITMRSRERGLDDIIQEQTEERRTQLRQKYSQINDRVGGSEEMVEQHQERHQEVRGIIDEIAALLGPEQVRPTVVTYATTSGMRAHRVIADPLTREAGNTGRSPASGIQFRDQIAAIVAPIRQDQHFGDETRSRFVFSMFRSSHLLAERLHGPAEPWNLSNTGTSINSQMVGPEVEAERLTNRGAELAYTATAEYYSDNIPPTDPQMIASASEQQKRDWLGALVARTYTVGIEVRRQPTDGGEPAQSRNYPSFNDGPNFITGIELIGGPPPRPRKEIVFDKANETAEAIGGRRRVRGLSFLAIELHIGVTAVQNALEELRLENRLMKEGERYFFV